MRLLSAFAVTAVAVLYALGAFYFFEQERWAREPSRIGPSDYRRTRHPDAILGLLQLRFETQHFGAPELDLVRDALRQAPTFYQGPFLLATYRGARFEREEAVRDAYEAALDRYPANGRLHVAYARWLLDSRTRLSGWRDPEGGPALRDPLPDAESHLRTGMVLEPELAWQALEALERYHVPPSRWVELTPDVALARRHLLDALARGRHYDVGRELLRSRSLDGDDVSLLRVAARLAFEGGDPELALSTAERFQAAVAAKGGTATSLLEPVLLVSRAHMTLGDADAANRVLEDFLAQVERRHGPKSRVSLEIMVALGDEYISRGQWVTAESLYAQALARDRAFVPALFGLARCLRHSGDVRGAVMRLEELLEIRPDHASARRELRTLMRTVP